MNILIVLLLVAATISFICAAAGKPSTINFLGLGLTFWVLTELLPALAALL